MALPTLSKLEQYYDRLDLIQATAKQIQKDFSLYDENIEFSETPLDPYQELYSQILPIVSRMLNLDSSRFFSLLYSIDLDEREVRSLIFDAENKSPAEELSHQIIRRELLKVLIRKYYSNQGREL